MACEKIQRPKYQICIGDLDEEIVIMSRTKAAYNPSGIAPDIDTSDAYTVWAAHDAYNGSRPFDDGTGQGQLFATDKFTIRFLEGIDITYVIKVNGVLYQIVDIQQLRKTQFMVIRAVRKGADDLVINLI